jgi:hypothetical protein
MPPPNQDDVEAWHSSHRAPSVFDAFELLLKHFAIIPVATVFITNIGEICTALLPMMCM